MEAVQAARSRLRKYPLLLSKCSAEASLYATCVLSKDNIKHSECEHEFRKLTTCLQKAAQEAGTRL